MTKLKIYQINNDYNFKDSYKFVTMREHEFHLEVLCNSLGWRILYEV